MRERQEHTWCLQVALTACLCVFSAAGTMMAAIAPPVTSYPAVAKPWKDVNLSFSEPGRVVKILAHRGQVVKTGQLLAQQDDQAELTAEQVAKIAADSTLKIQAAQAQLKQDQVDLKRTQWAAGQNAATAFEVQRAVLKVTIDKLSLQLAQLKHQHDQLDLKTAEQALRRREIKAPFDGVIEDRFIDAGGAVDAFKKVLEIVQVDRLRIFVPAPLPVATDLHIGQLANIMPASGKACHGRVIWIADVADSASNTQMVEIRVNNRAHIPAGQQVQVTFAPPQAAVSTPTDHGSRIKKQIGKRAESVIHTVGSALP